MSLIRECQPKTIEKWEKWYFEKAHTKGKNPAKITKDTLVELGERLYIKITEIVIPEWTEAFSQITLQDCNDYIYNLTINRTYDGFLREKSVVNDNLAKKFPEVEFKESEPQLDHAGDIDYLGWVGNKAIGIQIKPVTAQFSFSNYSPSERMKASFMEFERKYGRKVFIIFSMDDKIANEEILLDIEKEINRLRKNINNQ